MDSSIEPQINSLRRGDYKTIRELLFKHLRQLIISGRFPAGEKLVEQDLAEQFRVGRGVQLEDYPRIHRPRSSWGHGGRSRRPLDPSSLHCPSIDAPKKGWPEVYPRCHPNREKHGKSGGFP